MTLVSTERRTYDYHSLFLLYFFFLQDLLPGDDDAQLERAVYIDADRHELRIGRKQAVAGSIMTGRLADLTVLLAQNYCFEGSNLRRLGMQTRYFEPKDSRCRLVADYRLQSTS